jgi:hypothetical protein
MLTYEKDRTRLCILPSINQLNCPLLDGMPSPSEAPIDPLVVTAIKNAALKPFNNKKWISGRRGPQGWNRMEKEWIEIS